jgi:hypothetical protein
MAISVTFCVPDCIRTNSNNLFLSKDREYILVNHSKFNRIENYIFNDKK